MTKMAALPICGKTFKYLLQNRKVDIIGSRYTTSGTRVLPGGGVGGGGSYRVKTMTHVDLLSFYGQFFIYLFILFPFFRSNLVPYASVWRKRPNSAFLRNY